MKHKFNARWIIRRAELAVAARKEAQSYLDDPRNIFEIRRNIAGGSTNTSPPPFNNITTNTTTNNNNNNNIPLPPSYYDQFIFDDSFPLLPPLPQS